MRIRKRFPLPSTPSDLHLGHSAAAAPSDPPVGQPSDEVTAISDRNSRWARPKNDDNGEKMKLKEFGDEEAWREEEKKKFAGNDIREKNMPYEEECYTYCTFSQPSSSSSAAAKGDSKVLVPLKKRRGIFERNPNEETLVTARMKSKTNNKCDISTQSTEQEATDQNNNHHSSGTGTKKSKRGNVILEGSRCSRVNGRGWRCCQPTLVGYSLCEHHLGKGRLRSVSSVRRRHEDSWLQQPMMVTKKRTKVGVVKARSISSLLAQV